VTIKKLNSNNLLICALAIVVIVMSGLRPIDMGTDSIRYHINFQTGSWPGIYDYGFILYCNLLNFVSYDSVLLFTVSAFIIVSCFALSFKKYAPNPLFGFILFLLMFYPFSFNILRQYLASALFYFLAMHYLQQNDWKKYTISTLVISLFHYMMMVCIPLYFFLKKKHSYLLYISIWMVSIVFLFADVNFDRFIFLKYLAPLNPDIEFTYYHIDKFFVEKTTYKLYLYNVILIGFFYYLIKWAQMKPNITDKYSNLYLYFFNLYFFNVVFLNVFNDLRKFSRYNDVFGISIVFLISYVLYYYNKKYLYIFSLLAAASWSYYMFVYKGYGGLFG
jgi:hypothetical protein